MLDELMANLSAAFCEEYLRTFRVRLVDTDALKREAQRLRYQVYAVEHDFEPRNDDELECDVFDERASHALLFHRDCEEPLGTVRLVLPERGHKTGSLPIHNVCPADVLAKVDLPPGQTGEISRFALSKLRFKRVLGAHSRQADWQDDSRRILAFSCLGLITAVRQIARSNGITHLTAIMKPALLRRFESLGLSFDRLHGPVNHHGWRIPCYTRLEQLEASLQRHRPDLWSVYSASAA
jgi:N-acyl amino acid synthase of PEP-CTERM/exosortase system